MKISTEKLPKSLLALDIELDKDRVEKGLDRAAQRISQKHNIPGFRKGKAPRFIIEKYFGRDILLQEASNDLIQKAFKEALKQENIEPIGPAEVVSIDTDEEFRFRLTVPIPPSIELCDYRSIRIPLDIEPLTEDIVDRAMDAIRDRHVVLKELEDERPAQHGDQLTVQQQAFLDGKPLQEPEDEQDLPEVNVVLEPQRLIPGIYEGLLGVTIDETREITTQLPDSEEHEDLRGKDITFRIHVTNIQERVLYDWDEIPALEEFEGTLDDLRDQTRKNLEQSIQQTAENRLFESFIEQIIEQTTYDVADVTLQQVAEQMLNSQAQEAAQYGLTLEQLLQKQGKTREQVVQELFPMAEKQFKYTYTMLQLVSLEDIEVSEEDIDQEVQVMFQHYAQDENRDSMWPMFKEHLRDSIVQSIQERKLRDRLIAIATGALADESSAGEVPSEHDGDGEDELPAGEVPPEHDGDGEDKLPAGEVPPTHDSEKTLNSGG